MMKTPSSQRAVTFLRRDLSSLLHGAFCVVLFLVVFSYARALGYGENIFVVLLMVGSAYWALRGVYESRERWRSLLYAAIGLIVFVIASIVILFVATRFVSFPIAAINKILSGMQAVLFLPCAIGANVPPRRT